VIPDILDGNEAWLLRYADYHKRIQTRPIDTERVLLEIVSVKDEEPIVAVPVDTQELCEELVAAADSFYRRAKDDEFELLNECDELAFEVWINDADMRLNYYNKRGTQDRYVPIIGREQLKRVIADCHHIDRLREFVVQTDDIESFVNDLSDVGNDKKAKRWYKELLLSAETEIPSETAKALAKNPDEQAREALLQTRWKDQAEVVPHAFETLVELGGEDVRDALLETIGFTRHESIRVAAVECLSAFDDNEVRQRLQEVAADEEKSEEVRQAARESLAQLQE